MFQMTCVYILVINVTAACDRGCTASVGLLVTKEMERKEKAKEGNRLVSL